MAQSKVRYDAVIDAPFGRLGISVRDESVVDVNFLSPSFPAVAPTTPMMRRACRQLSAYFDDASTRFDIPLAFEGTEFQQRVWRALQRIPSGRAVTYGELARQLKSSARAVGNACRRNPIPVIVPCHRVVAVNGDGGFMGKRGGHALAIKRWLLAHERGG